MRWDTYQRQSARNEMPLIILQEDCYELSCPLSPSFLFPAVLTHLIYFIIFFFALSNLIPFLHFLSVRDICLVNITSSSTINDSYRTLALAQQLSLHSTVMYMF